jgi:hypothetical protein
MEASFGSACPEDRTCPAGAPPGGNPSSSFSPLDALRRELERRGANPFVRVLGEDRGSGALGTGLSTIDPRLPGGGFSRGRITEVTGGPSSGKRTIVGSAAARTLEAGGRVAWVDPGRAFDPTSAARARLPLDRLLLVRPQGEPPATESWSEAHREEAASATDAAFGVTEVLLRSRGFDLVILDLTDLSKIPPMGVLFRLVPLARVADAALVLLTESDGGGSGLRLGSAVSVRLRVRRRLPPERGLVIEVEKSKLGGEGYSIAV